LGVKRDKKEKTQGGSTGGSSNLEFFLDKATLKKRKKKKKKKKTKQKMGAGPIEAITMVNSESGATVIKRQ